MLFFLSAALAVPDSGTFQSSMWMRDAGIPSVIRDFVNFLMVLFGLEFDISSLRFSVFWPFHLDIREHLLLISGPCRLG